jgi:ABC-type lipoprotein release transport system permease subunit
MGQLRVILLIAWRNLFANRINWVIGAIILLGTFLVVVGGALLDSVDSSMSRSIIGSVTGNLQVYSDKSKDELSVYGTFGGDPDLAPITNFKDIKATFQGAPHVRYVVPMGISTAFVSAGNTVDVTLAQLRDVVRKEKDQGVTPELKAQEESLKDHVQQIVSVIQSDMKNLGEMSSDTERQEARGVLAKASDKGFWAEFDRDPYASLEFLENELAPQVADGDFLQMRYVGTDLDLYQQAFDRMEIVDGTRVPQGHRGFLFSKLYYEQFLKLKSARRLDLMKEAIDASHGRRTFANDLELQRMVKENQQQTREILLQLDSLKVKKAVAALQQELHSQETEFEPLLVKFFTMDDTNFERRYAFFYKELAPLLQLYRLKMGDSLTIQAYTRSGYTQSVNVKIYGTYRFKGMGEAPLAGSINLMDLVTFRELYGYLNKENLAEIQALKAAAGAKELDRSKAEDELFGGGSEVVRESHGQTAAREEQALNEMKGLGRARSEEINRETFTQDEIDSGVILNAAVLLDDQARLSQSLTQLQGLSDAHHLGLKVMTWQKAAGLIGQMVQLLKWVLYFFVFIIFVVALVIINNAMMMATLQRIQEIGTMRAVGAQRGFVLSMVLTETAALGAFFGAVGSALAAGLVLALRHFGIPAANDIVRFFFSGSRLYPALGPWNVIAAFAIVLVVSAISTLYPALIATRVSPIRAMQTEE